MIQTLSGRFVRVCLAILLVFSGYAFGSAGERRHLMTRSASNDSELLYDTGRLVSRQFKLGFADIQHPTCIQAARCNILALRPEASPPLCAVGAGLRYRCFRHLAPSHCLQKESVQQRLCC